jgi:hypothetical protein
MEVSAGTLSKRGIPEPRERCLSTNGMPKRWTKALTLGPAARAFALSVARASHGACTSLRTSRDFVSMRTAAGIARPAHCDQ